MARVPTWTELRLDATKLAQLQKECYRSVHDLLDRAIPELDKKLQALNGFHRPIRQHKFVDIIESETTQRNLEPEMDERNTEFRRNTRIIESRKDESKSESERNERITEPKRTERIVEPKIQEKNIRAERTKKNARSERIERDFLPERVERDFLPERIESNIQPERIETNNQTERVERNTQPARTKINVEPKKIERITEPERPKRIVGPERTRRAREPVIARRYYEQDLHDLEHLKPLPMPVSEYLKLNRPGMICRADQRVNYLRRRAEKRKQIASARVINSFERARMLSRSSSNQRSSLRSSQSMRSFSRDSLAPEYQVKYKLSEQEMKRRTARKYNQLPEVKKQRSVEVTKHLVIQNYKNKLEYGRKLLENRRHGIINYPLRSYRDDSSIMDSLDNSLTSSGTYN